MPSIFLNYFTLPGGFRKVQRICKSEGCYPACTGTVQKDKNQYLCRFVNRLMKSFLIGVSYNSWLAFNDIYNEA